VAQNSSMVVRAGQDGTVTSVDAHRIVIDEADEYMLRKFVGLNERTCMNQKPIVKLGQSVKKGEIIADGAATYQGELALGRNVLVGFMMFDGYNFEDAILISEKLVKNDTFTSIHIEEYDIECRETKLGREEFTRDIPNVSEKALANLDEGGVVRVGTKIKPGDILVGKVSPKSKSELSPEEKLLYAIFGRAGEDVKNDSLEVPSGQEGVVIDAKRFSRRMYMSDEQKKAHAVAMKEYEAKVIKKVIGIFHQMAQAITEKLDIVPVDPATRQKMGASTNDAIIKEQIDSFDISWIKQEDKRKKAEKIIEPYWKHIQDMLEEKKRKVQQMKRGDELPSGVLEMVKIYIATKRQLAVGDKMAGRHGNKGVIARILPVEDMPHLEDGTPLEILLNPLGVPGRMNVGQILETHLGWAAKILGFQALCPVFDGASEEQVHAVVEEANRFVRARKEEIEGKPKNRPRFNREKPKLEKDQIIKIWSENIDIRLRCFVNDCIEKAKQDQGWENDWKKSPKYPGIYFFRDKNTKCVNEGYVGIAGRRKGEGIHGRMNSHYSKNFPGDSLRKNIGDYINSSSQSDISNYLDKNLEYNYIKLDFSDNEIDDLLEKTNEVLDARKNKEHLIELLHHIEDRLMIEFPYSDEKTQLIPDPNELYVEMPSTGKITVYDGRTGEPFEQKVTVGYMYSLKLHHLVDDKIHARATGPYSLITQQPLGGKARTGGQRFGEMEVWGLEAYGTAYILQELLTVKSDDVEGRTKIYESMVKGNNSLEAGTPVSFDVLCNEIRGLGLNIQLEKKRL